MKIKHILLATILFSLGNLSFANNLKDGYVHTPNASEFGRYGEVPVSLYNGTANISVSLFETEQQGVPFQIALSYDNRGAHVIDLPTWVGQEWSLSCGGVINRVVKDIADEWVEPAHLSKGQPYKNYFSSCGKLQALMDSNADKKKIRKERQEGRYRYDFSPDVFMFNFCGKSGRFMLGQDGQWKVYCDENLDIIFDVNDLSNYIEPFIKLYPIGGANVEPKVIKGFTIIDQNGIRYHFGMNPDAIEYSTSRLGVYNGNDQIPWNANSWYLTKIEDRNANILYEFEYERGPFITQAYKTVTISAGPFEANIMSPVYMKKIKLFDGRSIVFDVRKGFPTDETCFGSSFRYQLANPNAPASYSCYGYAFLLNDFSPGSPWFFADEEVDVEHPFRATGVCYLDNIQIEGGKKTRIIQFKYDKIAPLMHLIAVQNKANSSNIESQYQFKYTGLDKLPNALFPDNHYVNEIGCWKQTDCTVGMLSDIIYPTGGISNFQYELNSCDRCIDFFNHSKISKSSKGSSNLGLRIKAITNYEDSTKTKLLSKREFQYQDGIAFLKRGAVTDYNEERLAAVCADVPHSFTSDLAYTYAKEIINDSIIIDYKFSSPETKSTSFIKPVENEYNDDQASCTSDALANDNDNDYSFLYGKLLEKKTSRKGSNIVASLKYNYDFREKTFVYSYEGGYISKKVNTQTNILEEDFYIFKEFYGYPRIEESEELINYGDNTAKTISYYNYTDTEEKYSFPIEHKVGIHNLKSKKTLFLYNKLKQKDYVTEEYEYEFNKKVDVAISNSNNLRLSKKGIFFAPLKRTRLYQNGTLVKDVENQYRTFGNMYQLAYKIDHSFGRNDTLISYLKYTDRGMPMIIQEKGMPETYLSWSDKHQLLGIATSPEPVTIFDTTLLKRKETDCILLTYKNLMVESVQSTGKRKICYEYDNLDRLVKIRDFKGNVISSFSYHLQEGGENFIEHKTYQDEQGTDYVQSVQYYDGLGRPTLIADNSRNWWKKYVYSLTEYDQFGRVSKVWSPVVGTSTPTGSVAEQVPAMSKALYNDSYGYVTTHYDDLGRVVKTTRSGNLYHTQDKSVKISYSLNKANDVKKYSLQKSGRTLPYSYYLDKVLTCQTTVDENGSKTEVFKDYRDLTVLERRYDGDEKVETYYVYDGMGQLTYVLQPMYQEEENLDKFAFQYEYENGLLKMKKLPGCEPVCYWYDKYDRLSKMQDGVMAEDGLYRVYAYDNLGRLKKQSISNGQRIEYDEIENFYDDYEFLKEHKDLIPGNNVDKENLDPNYPDNGHGLLTGVLQRASNGEPMLMSHTYDDYLRLIITREIGLDKHLGVVSTISNFNGTPHVSHNDFYRYDKTVGKLNDNSLYAWQKHLNCPRNNNMHQTNVIYLQYDPNQKQKSVMTHSYAFDDFGRITRSDRAGNAADMEYSYDNLQGWLTEIESHGGFKQTLYHDDIDRNPRFDGSISAMSWNVGDDIKSTYHYRYDGLNRLKEADYSSDMDSYVHGYDPEHRSLIPMERLKENYSTSYTYDKNCNIKTLERLGTTNTSKDETIDYLEMDYSGNQLKKVSDYVDETLSYAGAFDFQDQADNKLEYSYNANGAMTQDQNKDIEEIEYDLLGHPVFVSFSDRNSIEYVYAADGRKLRTIYNKAQKVQGPRYRGKPVSYYYVYLRDTIDYVNAYVFKNGKPIMFQFHDGYYSFDKDGKLDGYHLYVKDYQGNVRLVVNGETDSIEQVNHYYPYGALMGDISTSQDFQKYKYSGKELDRKFGLDLYDFHARQQDPLIGRFTSIDPMAEKYYGISPYAYCAGNPVNYTDPTGSLIRGNTREDAAYVVADLQGIFSDVKFADFRQLIVQSGKHQNGKTLAIIKDDAVKEALKGVELSADEQALVDLVVKTISDSDHTHVVEYSSGKGIVSSEAESLFAPEVAKLDPRINMDKTHEIYGGLPNFVLESLYGGGCTVPTQKGSYTVIFPDGEHPNGRSVTTGHELVGHGHSLAAGKTSDYQQHECAIQVENLILRVMNIPFVNDGSNHGNKGYVIPNPSALPNF